MIWPVPSNTESTFMPRLRSWPAILFSFGRWLVPTVTTTSFAGVAALAERRGRFALLRAEVRFAAATRLVERADRLRALAAGFVLFADRFLVPARLAEALRALALFAITLLRQANVDAVYHA